VFFLNLNFKSQLRFVGIEILKLFCVAVCLPFRHPGLFLFVTIVVSTEYFMSRENVERSAWLCTYVFRHVLMVCIF